MITLSQIKSVIKKQLAFFNRNKVDITDDTTCQQVLDHNFNNAQKLFMGNVRWTIHNATGKDKRFPSGWLSLSVSDLASKLVILLLILFSSFMAPAQLKVNVGAVRTDLRQSAINIGFSYLHDLDSLYGGQDLMVYGKKSWFLITPDVEFKTGTSDAFSSITAKATGLFTHFQTTTVDGIETPDADKTLQVFPVSLGAETNNRFDFVNTLVEAGYQPYYQSETRSGPDWIKHTRFGVYLQAGYKFKIDSAAGSPIGGQVDQSAEAPRSGLFRAKGNFSIDTKEILKVSGFSVGLVGNSNLWRDFVNGKWYYQVQGIGRVYLTSTTYFDFEYLRGSGAPNFNEGDQWGAGLTIKF